MTDVSVQDDLATAITAWEAALVALPGARDTLVNARAARNRAWKDLVASADPALYTVFAQADLDLQVAQAGYNAQVNNIDDARKTMESIEDFYSTPPAISPAP